MTMTTTTRLADALAATSRCDICKPPPDCGCICVPLDEQAIRADERERLAVALETTVQHLESLADIEDARGDKNRAYIRRGAAGQLRRHIAVIRRDDAKGAGRCRVGGR